MAVYFSFMGLTTLNTHSKSTALVPRRLRLATNVLLLFSLTQVAVATTFAMPKEGESLLDNHQGKPHYIKTKHEDTLVDIAVKHLLGQEEIVHANRNIDRWLPGEGKQVLIPSQYLLPDAPRQGIVINLPEFRLYYYLPSAPLATVSKVLPPLKLKKLPPALPAGKKPPMPALATPPLPAVVNMAPPIVAVTPAPATNQPSQVISYAVGVGRYDWKTPLGVTRIIAKIKDPTWTPPDSIKAEHLAKGDPLQDVYPAGPDNPLGLYALRLGIPGYLLHSTNRPQGVGMQVSHGCMRLYPADIEKLFPLVEVGTQITIINQPVKVGWGADGGLYVESHPNLDGEELPFAQRLELTNTLIQKAMLQVQVSIDEATLKSVLEKNTGLPTLVSTNENELPHSPWVDDDEPITPMPRLSELEDMKKPTPSSVPTLNSPTLKKEIPSINSPATHLNNMPTLSAPVAPKKVVPSLAPVLPKLTPAKPPKEGMPSLSPTVKESDKLLEEREFKSSPFPH